MRLAALTLLAVAVVGCGRAHSAPPVGPPDIVTRRGVSVWLGGFYASADQDAWGSMDHWMDRMSSGGLGASVAPCQGGLTAIVSSVDDLNDAYALDCSQGPCDRITGGYLDWDSRTIRVAARQDSPSPWRSAYVHEQLHALHRCWGWTPDPEHVLYASQWAMVDSRP